MPIKCGNCERENEEEFKFCLGCGSALNAEPPPQQSAQPDKVSCPSCAMEIPVGFKFCGACGTSLADVQPGAGGSAAPAASSSPQPQAQPQSSAGGGQKIGELTVIRPDGSEGARIPLTSSGVVLGRKSEYEVLANDPFLAPSHAEIRHEAGRTKLRNLDSVNGVFWRLRDDVELQDGDLIRIGQEILRFEHFANVKPLNDGVNSDAEPQGSPDPGVWGRLALIGGPDLETRAFALSGSEVTIGRELGNILFNDDGFVSGKHAKVYRDNGRVYLRDLGSSNGSYIRIRQERQLTDGDLVLMGQQLLRVSM